MAQRITRLTTDQKIAGSNPAEFGVNFGQNQPCRLLPSYPDTTVERILKNDKIWSDKPVV